MGGPPRARLPRRGVGRLGRGPAHGVGRAQLEGRRQGHHSVQLRGRSGPLGPRRLHVGGQPADLGLRVQLRRTGRHRPREGEPDHAEADAPQLGGGGHQRAVQLDRLSDAGLAQRRPHDAGRHGPGVGGQRWARELRRPARAQRRRHADRRRLLAGEGQTAQRPRSGGRHRPQGGQLPLLVRRTHPGRVGVAAFRQGHPGPGRRPSRRSSSNIRGGRRWVRPCSPASGAGPSSPAPPRPVT